MSENTKVARPMVPVRRLEDGRHRAECRHCPWTLESSTSTRAEIELHVQYHRHQHHLGNIEVTPRG